MTTQYNVVTYGNLTNTNGVLSEFSLNDYASLPKTLENLTINSLEIVFKFKITDNSSDSMIFWTDTLSDPYTGGLRIYSNNSGYSYGLEVTHNNSQVGYIESEGNLLILDTYYFIKVTYNNLDGYGLYKSDDGETYTLIGTISNTTMPSNPLSLIGVASPFNSYLHGAIDLNGSYIKVNGSIWWKGVQEITKIQLRHDTAANWTSVNPILLEGEVGIETDTRKQKFGDGSTSWNSLPYDANSTALNSKADTNLSNLSSTGKAVIDGQWVSVNVSIGTADTSLNGSTELPYTLETIPNDGYKYEAMISIWGTTGATNGNSIEIQVRSDELSNWININRGVTRTSSAMTCSGNVILPLSTSRKLYIRRKTDWNGVFTAQLKGYRRIGTNS